MTLYLTRYQFRSDGIFGELKDSEGNVLCVTLEHAYEREGAFWPKVPAGTYSCNRGMHRLHGMPADFETFEIMGVPHCTGILFHWGNKNSDSEGCVLVGRKVSPAASLVQHSSDGKQPADNAAQQLIVHSRESFAKLMAAVEGLPSFELVVSNV